MICLRIFKRLELKFKKALIIIRFVTIRESLHAQYGSEELGRIATIQHHQLNNFGEITFNNSAIVFESYVAGGVCGIVPELGAVNHN